MHTWPPSPAAASQHYQQFYSCHQLMHQLSHKFTDSVLVTDTDRRRHADRHRHAMSLLLVSDASNSFASLPHSTFNFYLFCLLLYFLLSCISTQWSLISNFPIRIHHLHHSRHYHHYYCCWCCFDRIFRTFIFAVTTAGLLPFRFALFFFPLYSFFFPYFFCCFLIHGIA